MRKTYPSGSGSVAAIMGHPLHPMIVPLPIGALVAAFAADIMFVATGNTFWADAAFYLLLAGIITGVLAALVGVIELAGLMRARTMGLAWAHGIFNVIAIALAIINAALRTPGPESVLFLGLGLSAITVALLLVSGWLGGELTFRHGIGVSETVGAEVEVRDFDRTPAGRPDLGKS